jgi:hypothetical protein
MADFIPWNVFPGLTEERLSLVAALLTNGRHSAVMSHLPSEGDDAWTLGSVAYRRSCHRILLGSKEHDWLKILPEEHNRFTFSIGSHPVKFYQGKGEDPPSKSLAVSFTELAQMNLAFGGTEAAEEHRLLRLAVETDKTGEAERVILVELDANGNVENTYTIPAAAMAASQSVDSRSKPVIEFKAKPVDPGPPSLEPLEIEEEQKSGKEDNASAG